MDILYIPNLALMETDGMYDDIHMSENHGYIRGYEWNIYGTIKIEIVLIDIDRYVNKTIQNIFM